MKTTFNLDAMDDFLTKTICNPLVLVVDVKQRENKQLIGEIGRIISNIYKSGDGEAIWVLFVLMNKFLIIPCLIENLELIEIN